MEKLLAVALVTCLALVWTGAVMYLYGWNLQTIYRNSAGESRTTMGGSSYWMGGISRRLGRFMIRVGLVPLPVLLILAVLFT